MFPSNKFKEKNIETIWSHSGRTFSEGIFDYYIQETCPNSHKEEIGQRGNWRNRESWECRTGFPHRHWSNSPHTDCRRSSHYRIARTWSGGEWYFSRPQIWMVHKGWIYIYTIHKGELRWRKKYLAHLKSVEEFSTERWWELWTPPWRSPATVWWKWPEGEGDSRFVFPTTN